MNHVDDPSTLLRKIQKEIRSSTVSLPLHAQQQTTARRIAIRELREALLISKEAEMLENYPKDPRGPSCLLYGKSTGRVPHLYVSHPPEIVVITAYEPDPSKWKADLKRRKRK